MRVELLTTLKGEHLWKKGMVFDDAISPIPKDIGTEVARGARTIRVLPEPRKAIKVSDTTPEMSENSEVVEGQPDVNFSPMAATEDQVVEAETDNASFITEEKPTKHLPELEGLIHAKGTIAAVANLLNVSYQTVGRWRKGGNPKPEMLKQIKKEYDKLMRLGNDQERIDDIASAGIKGAYIEPK